jgi:hypothetical protein
MRTHAEKLFGYARTRDDIIKQEQKQIMDKFRKETKKQRKIIAKINKREPIDARMEKRWRQKYRDRENWTEILAREISQKRIIAENKCAAIEKEAQTARIAAYRNKYMKLSVTCRKMRESNHTTQTAIEENAEIITDQKQITEKMKITGEKNTRVKYHQTHEREAGSKTYRKSPKLTQEQYTDL